MRWHRDWRIDSGYIGCCYKEAEFKLFAALLRHHGIPVERRGCYSTMGITISLYTSSRFVRRAREIRRGFKAGLLIRGDAMDFLLGLRSALSVSIQEHRLLAETNAEQPRSATGEIPGGKRNSQCLTPPKKKYSGTNPA
jgi:hypothetical protein